MKTFSRLFARFEEIMSGLSQSHEAGMKVPVPQDRSYEPQMPPIYNDYVKDMGLD